MTINQKYYAINQRLSDQLYINGVACPVIQGGIDPATLKVDQSNTSSVRYPYVQTHMTNVDQQSWTSTESGIFTTFDYHLSYFTTPGNEFKNRSKYFYPFEVVKNLMSDIKINLLEGLAAIQSTTGPFEFELKSGQAVVSSVMIYRMWTVCSYALGVDPATLATDIDQAIVYEVP